MSDAGVTSVPDRPEDAWSWDEYGEVAQKVADAARDGSSAFGVNWQALGAFRWLNSPEGRKALELTASFFERGRVPGSTSTKAATVEQLDGPRIAVGREGPHGRVAVSVGKAYDRLPCDVQWPCARRSGATPMTARVSFSRPSSAYARIESGAGQLGGEDGRRETVSTCFQCWQGPRRGFRQLPPLGHHIQRQPVVELLMEPRRTHPLPAADLESGADDYLPKIMWARLHHASALSWCACLNARWV